MTQEASHQHLITDAMVTSRTRQCAIYGAKCGNRLGFSLCSLGFACQCNSTSTPYNRVK
jgi:hypothetical protein